MFELPTCSVGNYIFNVSPVLSKIVCETCKEDLKKWPAKIEKRWKYWEKMLCKLKSVQVEYASGP